MRININRLGPLQDSSLDFSSPITIIFGRSNTGKSYVLKAIYSSLSFFDESNNYELARLSLRDIKTDSAYKVNLIIPLKLEVERLIEDYLDTLVEKSDFELYVNNHSLQDIIKSINDMIKSTEFQEKSYSTYRVCSNTGYNIRIKAIYGELRVDAENYSTVNDEVACKGALQNQIMFFTGKYLSENIIPQVMSSIAKGLDINTVRFLTYGKFLTLIYDFPHLLTQPQLKSSSHWILKNLKENKDDEEITKLFSLKVRIKEGKIIINEYETNHSSASLVELASIYLTLADGKGGLILIEEPETQLDVYNQVRIALILYNLAEKFRFIITTHSESLLLTMAMLAEYHGCLKEISEFKDVFGIDVPLGNPKKITFYLVKDGKLNKKEPSEILENDEIFYDVNRKLLKVNATLYYRWEKNCQQK